MSNESQMAHEELIEVGTNYCCLCKHEEEIRGILLITDGGVDELEDGRRAFHPMSYMVGICGECANSLDQIFERLITVPKWMEGVSGISEYSARQDPAFRVTSK